MHWYSSIVFRILLKVSLVLVSGTVIISEYAEKNIHEDYSKSSLIQEEEDVFTIMINFIEYDGRIKVDAPSKVKK